MSDIINRVASLGVVPVIKIDDVNDAVPLCKALADGGIDIAEITFRTEAAEESIKRVTAELPEILVGAGTIINREQLERAHKAGAQFIVSPGLSVDVVKRCNELGLPVFPGCVTPTEIITALSLGVEIIKFFPAENYGGLKTMKALAGPFPQVKFIPTGGVSAGNLKEYLEFGKVVACGGSWMVSKDLAETTKLSKEAIDIVKGVRK